MKNKRLKKCLFLGLVLLLGPALYFVLNYHVVKTTCLKLDVKISDANIPHINVLIGNKVCPLLVDLGSPFPMCLDSDFLHEMKLQECDLIKWRDMKGNSHKSKSYLIPKVNISQLSWTNVIAHEENQAHKDAGIMWIDNPQHRKDERKGKIGIPLLQKTNLCLDLYHRTIYFCNSLKMLQKMAVCPKKMSKVPFFLDDSHIVVQLESDIGKLNFVVDTGCTLSILKSPLEKELHLEKDRRGFDFLIASHLILGGKDFGELKIYVLDVDTGSNEIHGFLGMNFLENHVIYIDFPNQVLYVGNCSYEDE